MSDVRLYISDGDGEIDYVNGRAVMADGLETAVILSLFGGNERDSGGQDTDRLQWWGNLDEQVQARRYRSETQYLLRALPLVPRNLLRIHDAAERDLAWLMSDGPAERVVVTITMPALNTVKISVEVKIDTNVYLFEFVERGAQAAG